MQKVAPWLTLDGDPYPAVVNGRIVWILDGYTTSSGYPYSERTRFGDVTNDANTGGNRAAQANNEINYIRNSVKATVDAYTGDGDALRVRPERPGAEDVDEGVPGHGQDRHSRSRCGRISATPRTCSRCSAT